MPLNIADAESSFSKGKIEFQEWKDAFEARWIAPLAKTQLAMFLNSLTPEQRAAIDPVKLAQVERLMEG